ncbi:MAG: hypothetical protein ACXW2G_07370 [Burkholderiaceae bacterium]
MSKPTSAEPAEGFRGSIRATLWPTRALAGSVRWFDELYIWTEGSPAGTTQRANIQINSLRDVFQWLEYDLVEQIGVTISFGTVERALDPLTALFERNVLLAHRTHVMFRGTPQRLRSRYRLRALADMLRGLGYPVGYRLSAPRVSMELAGVDLVQPIFAKVLATTSPREEAWQDLALEVRALGLDTRATIVGGIEVPQQARMAHEAGFGLGQGRAVRQPYPPPSIPEPASAAS